jgi:hypothetical protein
LPQSAMSQEGAVRDPAGNLARIEELHRAVCRSHRRSSGWDSFDARRCFGRAERKPAKKGTRKPAKSTAAIDKTFEGFTDEERVAMKERTEELKAAARRGPRADKADGEAAVLAKIAEMQEPDRAMAEVVCFFQSAEKFKARYATFGFSDKANLDEGDMWPTAFALTELTAADEARIAALVKKAVS